MRAILLALMAVAPLQQPATRLEFDAVSVKPGDANDPASLTRSTPGGLEMTNATLIDLVRRAYSLNQYQLTRGPKWASTAKFNIEAKMPVGAARTQLPEMMQAMLASRFHLTIHRETRSMHEYALVVAKGGVKLVPAPADTVDGGGSGTRMIQAQGATMAQLAGMLMHPAGAPVVDRTGVPGKFKISLQFAPLLGTEALGTEALGAQARDENLPDIFGALQRVGLKLEPIKGPVEVVVIDSAEMPTAN